MNSSKDFFDRLKTDEAFANEFSKKVSETGVTDIKSAHATVIATAAEYGYEVTQADLDAIVEQYGEELSAEELGKVAGGTSPIVTISLSLFSIGTVLGSATLIVSDG